MWYYTWCFTFGVLLAMFGLVACAKQSPYATPEVPKTSDTYGQFQVTTVTVGDRQIPCITWWVTGAGGLSCDWSAK